MSKQCLSCRGYGKVIALGNLLSSCSSCDGIGFTTEQKIVDFTPPKVKQTAQEALGVNRPTWSRRKGAKSEHKIAKDSLKNGTQGSSIKL